MANVNYLSLLKGIGGLILCVPIAVGGLYFSGQAVYLLDRLLSN